MKTADQQIIQRLNEIYDAQAAPGGGAPAFAEITGDPSDNTALDAALDLKQTAAQVQAIIDATPGVRKSVAATAHGFVVGDVLRMDGTAYVKAQSDSDTNAEAIGMVASVTDANNFVLATGGFVSGLSGLTAGAMHFLSPTTAGAITATEPSTDGQISKPVFIATTTTAGYFFNMRGSEVGGGAAAPYLVYTALLTQSGGDAPVATVLQNTLGGTIVWARADDGFFEGTLAGAFTANKTTTIKELIFSVFDDFNEGGDVIAIWGERASDNVFNLKTRDINGSAINNALLDKLIEIRVYP